MPFTKSHKYEAPYGASYEAKTWHSLCILAMTEYGDPGSIIAADAECSESLGELGPANNSYVKLRHSSERWWRCLLRWIDGIITLLMRREQHNNLTEYQPVSDTIGYSAWGGCIVHKKLNPLYQTRCNQIYGRQASFCSCFTWAAYNEKCIVARGQTNWFERTFPSHSTDVLHHVGLFIALKH